MYKIFIKSSGHTSKDWYTPYMVSTGEVDEHNKPIIVEYETESKTEAISEYKTLLNYFGKEKLKLFNEIEVNIDVTIDDLLYPAIDLYPNEDLYSVAPYSI